MSTDIILFRHQADSIEVLPMVEELKDNVLILANRVRKVTSKTEEETAVAAQIEMKAFLDMVEASRVFIKTPVLEKGALIDALARKTAEEVNLEFLRVARIVGDYKAAEAARMRADEALRLKDLAEVERKRQFELSQAQTLEQADIVQEKFNNLAAQLPPVVMGKVAFQRLSQDWDITVTDYMLLAREHPTCVNITEKRREIKALLNAGIKVAGIMATKITKASVTVPKDKALIEV